MTYNILFPTTTVTASTHILQRGEPGYDETTNTLKIGDGSTTFAALQAIGSEGSGDVVGPSSATDHAIARYDLTTGKLIQDSSVTIDDSGNVTANSFVGPLTGNADTASTLETARTITLTGDISGSTSFNGGANVSITSTLPTVATAGTYKSVTVNTKGQVTAGTNPTTLAGYGITDASLATHNHTGTYQPIDTDLTAIAALSGTYGFLKKTAANTWAIDTNEYLTTSHTHTVTDTIECLIVGDDYIDFYMPYAATIIGWRILVGYPVSLSVYIYKSTYSAYPTMSEISSPSRPVLNNATKAYSDNVTSWTTTTINAGDIIRFYVAGTYTYGGTVSLIITRTI